MMLTPKQARFVEEYIVDLNGKQAAIRAGYSPKTAEVQASRMLRYAQVQAALKAAMEARSKRTQITADRVVTELAKLAFANLGDYLPEQLEADPYKHLQGLDRGRRAALEEVQVEHFVERRGEDARQVRRIKFKVHDKNSALDSLARHLGMFPRG